MSAISPNPRHSSNDGARKWDGAAMGISALCLVHCVAPPLIAAFGPAVSRLLHLPEWIHLLAFLIAMPVTSLAIFKGYRHHGNGWPAVMAFAGVTLIGLGAIGGLLSFVEAGVTVSGSGILLIAHLRNWRLVLVTASPGGRNADDKFPF